MTGPTPEHSDARLPAPALMFIALVVAAIAGLGALLITSVATTFHVSLDRRTTTPTPPQRWSASPRWRSPP
ncbi:hypothetical protein ACIRST_19985 [Kitasatospora sp. NPDC101447]|uniref:hypothetical protein n=1 Tax=Kitasatospora sp. NPDC101447 TaxID=3364102 RepID=UPI00383066DA